MTAVPTVAATAQTKPVALRLARWFYPLSGALLLVCTVAGFQLFYLHGRSYPPPGREIPPPIRSLVVIHGVAMSAWILLFVMQPALFAGRNIRLHMRLGRLGVALAGAVVVLGTLLAVRSAQVTPPEARIWNMPPRQFMSVPLISVWVFAVLVGIAVWKRRRPAVHRAMMFVATLCVTDAAISRIDPINHLFVGTAWERQFGPFFAMLVLGLGLLGVRCLLTRSLDRPLAIGMGVLVATSWLTIAVSRTAAWEGFASMLVR